AAGNGFLQLARIEAVAGDRGELQPWRADIEQTRDALARQQLAAPVEQRLGFGRFSRGAIFQRVQLRDQRQHMSAIAPKGFAAHINAGLDGGHHATRSFPRKRESSSWPSTGSPLSRGRAESEALTPAPSA